MRTEKLFEHKAKTPWESEKLVRWQVKNSEYVVSKIIYNRRVSYMPDINGQFSYRVRVRLKQRRRRR